MQPKKNKIPAANREQHVLFMLIWSELFKFAGKNLPGAILTMEYFPMGELAAMPEGRVNFETNTFASSFFFNRIEI